MRQMIRDQAGGLAAGLLLVGLSGVALGLLRGGTLPVFSEAPDPADHGVKVDMSKIEGRGNCTGCHDGKKDRDTKAWEKSTHSRAMSLLLRSRKARRIRRKMGYRRADRNALCVGCHGQPARKGADVRLVDGVTCEMCHGPAKEWIKLHEHREKAQAAVAKGWIPPWRTYDLAANCMDCHVVSSEKLVDVAGHPAPRPFELVAWSQGEVRHNFNKEKGHSRNEPTSPARLRRFFVVGCLVDLEYSLRALSRTTRAGKLGKQMVARVGRLRALVGRIHARLPALRIGPEVEAALAGVTVAPGQQLPLSRAAARIGALARKVSDSCDGKKMGAVDALMPGPDKYMGKVFGGQ